MKNLVAVLIVVALLGACSAYVIENTHVRQDMHSRQELIPAYPATQWDSYVQQGGAFRGK